MDWKSIFGLPSLPKPSYIKAYEQTLLKKTSKAKPIRELDFLVLDTETTGLDVRKDYVLSYGSVLVSNNRMKISESKEYYMRPKKRSKEAVKVHGLIQVRPYVSREQLIRSFLEDASNKILVGHHLGFDLAMLEKLGKTLGLRKIKQPSLDTYELAVRLENGKYHDPHTIAAQDYSLDKLCERYKIALDDRHTAAGDALLTSQLLLKLLKVAERKGIKTFGDLMA
ncbi:3'-5' exonuclease [uncultured Cyclobacterium sp.]|uniref:3'-5' exonuclease n=1 Tax=uncultured Cyclobacterium sp. TaxID=453820 RepID=UPI0030EB3D82|tara:strand:- start:54959 stop:55633 length:675 start_codon:yes stop_codon:yes gene_type:complete